MKSEQLKTLPAKPGVYLFIDKEGKVIYVGKAANLSNRVKSYFGAPSSLSNKVQRLVAKIHDFEFVVTNSEQEALILECNMIKRYTPRYNVRLKDNKTFPYLKIDSNEDWPRVYITRQVQKDGARYFGPFASAGSVRRTLRLIKKIFPFRSCRKRLDGKDKRPCLDYYISRQIELESYGYRFLRLNKFNLQPEQDGETKKDVLDRFLRKAFVAE